MSDDPARWRRLEAVVQSALERPSGQRAAYLADACRGDDDLRREAESLLDREARAADFLSADVAALAADAITYSPGGTPAAHDPRLAVGDKLGPYEIRARLGAGGMGEVYRAFDHSLGREVAIKLLPSMFSSDPERLARFEREARLLASLAHPQIGAIYGLQQSGDLRAIVLELIEGETLEARLRRGSMPVDQALTVAVQIAEALDHAHRRGVTHRDLKPANIMMTKAGARLLDFGLARWSRRASGFVDKAAGSEAERPEGVDSLTVEGTILGTPQYMAPEQLEGRAVDARADVFAFGAVFYEMLAAKPAFDGSSRAAVMAAVLNTEPSFAELPPIAPAVERVMRKCLAKSPDDRWQTTRDLSDELKWVASTRVAQAPAPAGREAASRRRLGIASAAALIALVLSVAGWAAWRSSASDDAGLGAAMRFSISPRAPILDFAISPDGSTVTYTHAFEGAIRLFIRRFVQFDARPVPDTQGANGPMFSPDGKWVAFFSKGRLLKVNVETHAAPILLSDMSGAGLLLGGHWLADGTILFSRTRHGLQRISDNGGAASELTARNQSPVETDHHNPVMLPGGETVLFTLHDSDGQFHVAVETLKTKQRKVLLESAYDARYLSSGHLIFARDRRILAAPFNLRALEITGPEVTLVEDVAGATFDGAGGYQLSPSGTLVYKPVTTTDGRRLTWVDRSGVESALDLPPRRYNSPSISPDGRYLAFSIDEGAQRDIYLYDLRTSTEVRLTRSGDNRTPIWTRDSQYLTYSTASRSNALGRTLVRHPIDQSSVAKELVSGYIGLVPGSWTLRDERLLFTDGSTLPDGTRIYALTPSGPHRPEQIVDGPRDERQPSVSPDGRWLAFMSTETGRSEVYVTAMLGGSTPRQLSIEGGRSPKWSKDGREISYRTGRRMMAIAFDPASGAAVGRPRLLFEGPYVVGASDTMGLDFDLSPDGRFLMIKPGPDEQVPQPLHVVVNWMAEIRSRVAAPR